MPQLLCAFPYAALSAAAEAFRVEVRELLRMCWTPAPAQQRAPSWMGYAAAFSRKLARRGWVGVTLPKQPRAADAFADTVRRRAGLAAFEQAGIGPSDVSVAQVHDASAMGETIAAEYLGLGAMRELRTPDFRGARWRRASNTLRRGSR